MRINSHHYLEKSVDAVHGTGRWRVRVRDRVHGSWLVRSVQGMWTSRKEGEPHGLETSVDDPTTALRADRLAN